MNTRFDIAEFTAAISQAQAALVRFAETTSVHIEFSSRTFQQLAGEADIVLRRAASIVENLNSESLDSVLSGLQDHCLKAKQFQESRLSAAGAVLENGQTEIQLLGQVMAIGYRQDKIAKHLKALSVLTNIEAIHTGCGESGFRLLAQDLSAFSGSLLKQTIELVSYTERHKQVTYDILAALSSDLPHLKAEGQQMEIDLTAAMQSIDAGLGQLCRVPEQFSEGARYTAQQISGVIAAVQAHDITRQQIEHVQSSLEIIQSRMATADPAESGAWPVAHAGLSIQTAQLKMIKGIVAAWISQIGNCMTQILDLSVEELITVPAALLKQWGDLATQLSRLGTLQQKSQAHGVTIQQSLTGFGDLKSLVQKHMEQSQVICDRLRLLAFNSLIEAHNMGDQGCGVSAIAKLIRELAMEWTGVTDEFQEALKRITSIYNGIQEATEVFSDANSERSADDQAQTHAALGHLDRVARLVATVAEEMQKVTTKMRSEVKQFDATRHHLSAALDDLDAAQAKVQGLVCRLEKCYPEIISDYKLSEIEDLFGAFYTTESETEVMNAVLRGNPITMPAQSLAGNSVELF